MFLFQQVLTGLYRQTHISDRLRLEEAGVQEENPALDCLLAN